MNIFDWLFGKKKKVNKHESHEKEENKRFEKYFFDKTFSKEKRNTNQFSSFSSISRKRDKSSS